MLRLSEIRAVHESVDEDWRSPVADAVAGAWMLPPGAARWWRSSATHVFVVPGPPRHYLRFAPAGSPAAARLRRGADLAAAFPVTTGLSVSAPVSTTSGARTPTIDTPAGPMVAMLVEDATGDAVVAESLTREQAHRWGAALACFHGAAPVVDAGRSRLDASDPELTTALADIEERLERLDPRVHRRVTLHGDFELDNLRLPEHGVTVFDLDETRAGWAAEDVALATRDLRGEEGAPALSHLFDAFVAGYRSSAPFSDAELDAVPLHALAHSARRASDSGTLDEGARATDPGWQRELHASITEANQWHRQAVLAHAIRPAAS
ncbi:phosphotransferase enzyme family protein [Occultella aeris]|uniref:Phosphotransferase enzyme family protein n=1 Tax=Occultella aeris TaxID=2761496 RepID=A0A7M4DDD7_9MICO|nr:phosphotransferase [Occultella aeris]VZO34856.1 Phosphotransferase enzyme family protein [Occultella aeris]